MKLNLIQRERLDGARWNELVARTSDAAFFSYTWYLDAIAENWCVLVDENYSVGIALPFTKRLSQKILYTPIFVSYMELLGNKDLINFSELEEQIRSIFKLIEIEFKEPLLGNDNESFICQVTDGSTKRKSQVNRMLNKANRFELKVRPTSNWQSVFDIIKSELINKFTGMSTVSMGRLEEMYREAEKDGKLCAFEVTKDEICQGGVICFVHQGQLYYSKGATLELARDNGGMYLAMDAAIANAMEDKRLFDFGGSRVEGVRRFNHNFGGSDLEYFSYRIDNGPLWFKWIRAIKNKWFKKS
ncbi:MAG: hypothetical protein ACI865_003216 [Flavobacteriaceae bacterium]|jgi:hypothetical protein